MPRLASVAVPVPFLDLLTYRVPDGMNAVRGARVVVPLGRRLVTGLMVATRDVAEADLAGVPGDLRAIARVLDDEPYLPGPVVDLALWTAEYYICAPGDALAAAMPPRAWVESERRWTLTSAGEYALAEAGAGTRRLRDDAKRVLEALSPADAAAPADVARTLRRGTGADTPKLAPARVERVLERLSRAGLAASVQYLVGRADASKTERVVDLAAAADQSPTVALTAKQRDALDAIRDLLALEGAVPVTRLEPQGVSRAVLGALERKGLVTVAARRVERVSAESFGESRREDGTPGEPGAFGEHAAIDLTAEQDAALRDLSAWADHGAFKVALLHGVTGSGKTEVYRRLARNVCDRGRRALILVPEIALTPAVAARFRAAFGERVAIQHSALSDGERYDQWQRIRRGEVDVVVGTRSAVFAPLDPLGLVIVDEEHDTSYKQEDAPRYHGRDVAIVRARDAKALVVLGSATPSLESYQHALGGRYALVRLTRRVQDRPLAEVHVVDMREEFAEAGPDVVLSAALREAIAARLTEDEQAIILLNRRGYASNVFCRQCGDTLDCPNCSVSLTVHRRANRARCHYCDHARVLPDACVKCGGAYLEYQGIGTERVESEVREAFPGVRVVRVDRDTVRRRGEITRVLRRFARREIDVLVGTQMIAKGHDFPAVTLVGVVSADVGLGLADFRAAERTFQLLTQVAGRAGRGERPGEAIIQTLFPDHYSIRMAQAQDYAGFYALESHYRQSMRYPPAVWLASVVVRAPEEPDARQRAALIADVLRAGRGFKVLGPAPAPLVRLRGMHRVQLFLKGTHRLAMRQALRAALQAHPQLARSVTVDIDPITVL